MKKILCFGDSNTFGYIPVSGERYDENTRWTGILKQKLLPDYKVIEAGCNNRNGFIESNCGDEFTGFKVLPTYLSEKPDIVVLAIGINDAQKFYRPSTEDMKKGLVSMSQSVIDSGAKLVIVSPPVLNEDVLKGNFSVQFDEISVELSKQLPDIYKDVANSLNSLYIDLNEYVSVSPLDGLHYSQESHKKIADIIYNKISSL